MLVFLSNNRFSFSPRLSETDVRMTVSKKAERTTSPCELLRKRGMRHWNKGLFFDCDFEGLRIHGSGDFELRFEIDVNDTKLSTTERDLPYDYKMWTLNRMLNAGKKKCLTATGRATVSTPGGYIMVGPFEVGFCDKLKNETTAMNISECSVMEQRKNPVEGIVLATYQLQATVPGSNSSIARPRPNDLKMLKRLNLDGKCGFNGYWSPRSVEEEEEDDDDFSETDDDDDDDHTDVEETTLDTDSETDDDDDDKD